MKHYQLGVLLLIGWAMLFPSQGISQTSNTVSVLIVPLVNVQKERQYEFLRDVMSKSLAKTLNSYDMLQTQPYEQISPLAEQAGLNIDDGISADELQQIANIAKANFIIYGQYQSDDEGFLQLEIFLYDIQLEENTYELSELVEGDEIYDVIDGSIAALIGNLSVLIRLDYPYAVYNPYPRFFWQPVQGVDKYELYIDEEKVCEVSEAFCISDKKIPTGEHDFYTLSYVADQVIKSDVLRFTLKRFTPPVWDLFPDKVTYNQQPELKIKPIIEAKEYEWYINGKLAGITPQARFTPPKKLDFGTYEIYTIARNTYQNSKSKVRTFELDPLPVSVLMYPHKNWRFFPDVNPNEVKFQWTSHVPRTTHEIWVNNQKVGETKKNEFTWKMPGEGDYHWYIVSRLGDQIKKTEVRKFSYWPPKLKTGLLYRHSFRLLSDSDSTLSSRTHISAGFSAEWLFHQHLSLLGNISFSYDQLDINEATRYGYQVDELTINKYGASILIMVRGRYQFKKLILSGSTGFDIGIPLFVEQMNQSIGSVPITSNITPVSVSFVNTLRVGYAFNRWLEPYIGFVSEWDFLPLTRISLFKLNHIWNIGAFAGMDIYRY